MCNKCDRCRFDGVRRVYKPEEVEALRNRLELRPDCALARNMSRKLWHLFHADSYVKALGAMTGMQGVQMAKAGLKAIYCSGWQTAADANLARATYPDQSLYPVNSVPALVDRINRALRRADQIANLEKKFDVDFTLPIMADAEAGFGGRRQAFELMTTMIEAGAAGVHFEDQLGSEKKCGHLGGKVLVPTSQFIGTLSAARLAADTLEVPAIIVARTDAEAATLLTSEIDDRDKPFILGTTEDVFECVYGFAKEQDWVSAWTTKGVKGLWTPYRTSEGYFQIQPGLDSAIARAVAYAPYADLLWMETKTPDLADAKAFAEGVHAAYPGKFLMYNCSPSFNWLKHFLKKCDGDAAKAQWEIQVFQDELGKLGYKFVFITLAGFHSLVAGMFELANDYKNSGMAAYVYLQEREFEMEPLGFEAVRHQREVGTSFYDEVDRLSAGGKSSTSAMEGSTEKEQFGQ